MNEEETKTCENCKRDIPAINFTIHTVHCARNIRVCPVCKEPVPQAELKEHHEKLHKLLPCKQCGESVCGTDMEDHVRDSCAHTMKTCRFCALDLRRGSMPGHERYCGARTEQCAECGEWVMLKYHQLHLDSNHGFIRLDDDPEPIKKDAKATNVPKPLNLTKPLARADGKTDEFISGITKSINVTRPVTEIRHYSMNQNGPSTSNVVNGPISSLPELASVNRSQRSSESLNQSKIVNEAASSSQNGAIPRTKRTNDQPQVNSVVAPTDKVKKDLWASRGAVKKRPAPKPPTKAPADPKRDMSLRSALERQEEEEKQRLEQTAYNLSIGLPPVLSSAAKLEKLRKMDALQNPPVDDQEYKKRLQGRVWMGPELAPAGHMLGNSDVVPEELEVSRRKSKSKSKSRSPARNDLKNLKPMTPEEFMNRFNELQLRKEPEPVRDDRFSQIKSSLRELRRGLNEVTAPYNSNVNNNETNQNNRNRHSPVEEDEVALPCEFCTMLVPVDDLVQHQTGCRPDLAQYKPSRTNAQLAHPAQPAQPAQPASAASAPSEPIFIPCEFCTEPQPVYLLSEHQERCGRDANLLFAD